MNIRCPNCQTVFRIDPARIPADGVRARCSRCAHAFRVAPPQAGPPEAAAPAQGLAPATEPRAAHVGVPGVPPAPTAPAVASPPLPPPPTPAPGAHSAARAVPTPGSPTAPGQPAPRGEAAAPPAAAGAGPQPGASRPVFGSRDPKARAQRIARALVSDIVAYHRQRVEETLAGGTLRSEFREEILKSWDEYVAQVGPELAKGTPYFRDALNEILARGQKVF